MSTWRDEVATTIRCPAQDMLKTFPGSRIRAAWLLPCDAQRRERFGLCALHYQYNGSPDLHTALPSGICFSGCKGWSFTRGGLLADKALVGSMLADAVPPQLK